MFKKLAEEVKKKGSIEYSVHLYHHDKSNYTMNSYCIMKWNTMINCTPDNGQ